MGTAIKSLQAQLPRNSRQEVFPGVEIQLHTRPQAVRQILHGANMQPLPQFFQQSRPGLLPEIITQHCARPQALGQVTSAEHG